MFDGSPGHTFPHSWEDLADKIHLITGEINEKFMLFYCPHFYSIYSYNKKYAMNPVKPGYREVRY